jgi:hypothetical protein
MYVSPEFDENQQKQLNDSINLVRNNIKMRNKGNRKMLVVYPVNREPVQKEADKNWNSHWNMVNEFTKSYSPTYTNKEIQQVKRYPKLKMFFPELVATDVSLNMPPPPPNNSPR